MKKELSDSEVKAFIGSSKKMSMPYKLEVKNEHIVGYFDHGVSFVEMENGKNYPSAIFGKSHFNIAETGWIQFPPNGWDDMSNDVLKQMVDAWNEKYTK